MNLKKNKGLTIYIIIMIVANLVLAFVIGRTFIEDKFSNDSFVNTHNNNTAKHSNVAQQRDNPPSINDFNKWYYSTDRSIPAKADLNVTREDTYGSWKATIYVTGKKAQDDKILLLNIDIAGEEGNVTLTMDWYQSTAICNSETTDETSKKDTVLEGSWKNGAIVISDGQYELEIPHFYRLKNKEYGMGSGTIDGLRVDIGLVRDEQ